MGRNVPVSVISFLFFQVFITVHAQPAVTYGLLECKGNKDYYTKGDVYEKNLELVLKNLKAKSASLLFYTSAVGEGSSQVYGLYQCRMDISLELCNKCVTQATNEIFGECPFNVGEAILWYVECMVWYSDRYIFSTTYEISPVFNRTTGDKVDNKAEFVTRLRSTMTELIKNASSATPPCAAGKTNWTSFERLFSYAQCIPNLDIFGCYACLKAALTAAIGCCGEYGAAMVHLPSCQLRYDTKASFLLGDLPPSTTSSPRPPPPNKQVSETSKKVSSMKPAIIGAIGACVLVGLLVLAVVLWICVRRKKPNEAGSSSGIREAAKSDVQNIGDGEFLQYDFATLKTATANFSAENKLGHGGFGTVYKGTFDNGDHQLAIKRLSGTSGQGTKEFMTEAGLLAKLQHKNLVKLVGFCSEGDEKLLVYEFMSNASLDGFLFDQAKRSLLNWATRSKIIMGIARGLQYLHEDSRLTIVHRDLKPGNILLDHEMNPKIADFGLAKLFEGAQKYGNTSRVAGTIGYMAPEYMTTGEYSDKSDVYSFGIMLLEIVSGQNNIKFYQVQQKEDLPVHAWKLWNEERSFDLVDPVLLNNCSRDDVMRCIHIGLLCLQANAEQRPTMASIIFMLNGSMELPSPFSPAMSFPQFNMPIAYISGGQQSDVEQYSTMSVTQDQPPKPR